MADLGVTADLSAQEFLAAMAGRAEHDPAMAMVLSAIKSTAKGAVGKLRERNQSAGREHGERWPALERATWRPDIRAAVISTARVNMHRKLIRTALATSSTPRADRFAGVRPRRTAPDRNPVGLRRLPVGRSVAARRPALRSRRQAGSGHVPARGLARHGQARRDQAAVVGGGAPGIPAQPRQLAALGIKVAASTVWEILKEHGVPPAPERQSTTWADFLRSQADALLACDFFETRTLTGARLYVFAVIEHSTRRIRILGATAHPAAHWVV
ncbi:hypothetical protein GA0115240_15915 [Streptomyces sp. DvalAA-14]|nr:hypothetical protein GA0115240_15915 [Streptomyces sp. DvalAA-14]